jgi:hypothetical protein
MSERKLQIVTQDTPFIGFCEACTAQFWSLERNREDAEQTIKSAFAAHNCAEAPNDKKHQRTV